MVLVSLIVFSVILFFTYTFKGETNCWFLVEADSVPFCKRAFLFRNSRTTRNEWALHPTIESKNSVTLQFLNCEVLDEEFNI